ncbi:MAG: hypothetical protein ACOC9Y_04275 [Chloroflexota bacterium]
MKTGAGSEYIGNALTCEVPVSLPEPVASRAQSVSRSVAWRWMLGVAARDHNGYAIIAGNGRTVIVLFAGGRPVQAAVTRGHEVSSASEALQTIARLGTSDYFVLTYQLSPESSFALSGLFRRPAVREVFTDPSDDLREMLSSQLESEFTGAVTLRAMGSWAVLVVVDSQITGCYGSDDLRLKQTFQDATALFYGAEVEVSLHPAAVVPDIDALLREGTLDEARTAAGAEVEETEVRMIELLSELEHAVTKAEGDPDRGARLLTCALIQAYDRAITLAGRGSERLRESAASHPVLERHWDADHQVLDTAKLLETLEMARIEEAWLSAADALAIALEITVEQQLVWLALADEHASASLQEALTELLLQARGVVRQLRCRTRDVKDTQRTAGGEQSRSLARRT